MTSCSYLQPMTEFKSVTMIDYDIYLTEGVLFEVFLRLPFNCIFKYRCVSKLWLSLLSNPVLVSRKLENMTPSPWGLFYNLNQPAAELVSVTSLDPHIRFMCRYEGFSFRFLYSAISPYNKKEMLYLLASSNGLVLCSKSSAFQSKYYVCNPLTRKWVPLPPPPQSPPAWVLNGIICESSSSSPTSTSYKVVRIKECRDPSKTNFDLEIYSSDIGEWNNYKVSCPQQITLLYPFLSSVVSCNGSLYWIEGENRLIAYDLNNNRGENGSRKCRLIDLPDLDGEICHGYLGESEGFITYCRCHHGELTVWALDYFNGRWNWRSVHKIEINDILVSNPDGMLLMDVIARQSHRLPDYVNLRPLALDPGDPNVMILAYYAAQWYFYSYNMSSRRFQLMRNKGSSRCLLAGEVFPFVLTPRMTKLAPTACSNT